MTLCSNIGGNVSIMLTPNSWCSKTLYTRGNTWQCIETANTVYVHVILYSYVNDIQAPAIWNSVSSYEKYRYHFQGTSENCALSCRGLYDTVYNIKFLLPPAPPIRTLRHTAPQWHWD